MLHRDNGLPRFGAGVAASAARRLQWLSCRNRWISRDSFPDTQPPASDRASRTVGGPSRPRCLGRAAGQGLRGAAAGPSWPAGPALLRRILVLLGPVPRGRSQPTLPGAATRGGAAGAGMAGRRPARLRRPCRRGARPRLGFGAPRPCAGPFGEPDADRHRDLSRAGLAGGARRPARHRRACCAGGMGSGRAAGCAAPGPPACFGGNRPLWRI